MSKRIKYILAGCALLLVLIVAVPWLVPTSAWLGPLQEKASKALGAKVAVGDLRLALVPLPHLTATKIDIGEGAIRVESVTIYPELTTLFSSVRKIRSVNAEKLIISRKGTDMIAALAAAPPGAKPGAGNAPGAPGSGGSGTGSSSSNGSDASSAPPVEVGKLRLRDAEVEISSGKLPLIDLDVEMEGLSLVNALVSFDGGKAKLTVEPKGEGWDVALNASNWVLPVGMPLKFDSFKATGHATKQGLSMPEITGKMYGGELKAKADLGWQKNWRLGGNAAIEHLDIMPALQAMKMKAMMSGRLDTSGPFSAQAATPTGLVDTFTADFAFNVKDGTLHGFDLASAATNFITGAKGGQTRFDQLTGHALVNGHAYKLRGVHVASGALSANANVDISAAKQLGGRVDVDLKRTGGVVSVPLAVSGSVNDPILLPTKGAIAGALAGSVLLPGVGTAAGASVGDKIGKFFSR